MRGQVVSKLGIGITSLLLISRWMSANAMFTASEATVKYGILAGFSFAIMGALAFLAFGLIGQKIRSRNENTTSLWEVLEEKIDDRTRRLLFLLIGFGYGLDFLLLALGASIIFYATIGLPASIGVLLFIAFGLPLFFFRTDQNYGKYTIYKIGLFQSVIIVSVVYLFLSSNLEEMYFRMKLYHTYLFTIQQEELLFFTMSVFIIFLGKLVTDFGGWNILFRVKEGKIRQSFFLSGLFWATIPLSFTILVFPVLSQGGFKNIFTIFHDLLYTFESDFLLLLTAIAIFITLITTYYTRLHEFLGLFERTKFNKQTRLAQLMTILGVLFLYGTYYYFKPDLIELFFFAGVLNSSLLLPVLFLAVTKRKGQGRVIIGTILVSLFSGYIYYHFYQIHTSVLITFLISLVVLSVSEKVFKR